MSETSLGLREPDLRDELIALLAKDHAVRAKLAEDGSLFGGYHPRMEAVHRRNAARLAAIVEAHGWPGRALVGEEASAAAWTILQHAIGEPVLMRRGLAWLSEAAARGDVPMIEVAMLEDRIAAFAGRPQRYGTQYDWDDDGELSPLPIADPERMDERRRAARLPPLDEHTRRIRERTAEDPRPSLEEIRRRRATAEAWARTVGWRV